MYKFFITLILTSLVCSCGVKGDLHLPGQKPPSHKDADKKTDSLGNTVNKDK